MNTVKTVCHLCHQYYEKIWDEEAWKAGFVMCPHEVVAMYRQKEGLLAPEGLSFATFHRICNDVPDHCMSKELHVKFSEVP